MECEGNVRQVAAVLNADPAHVKARIDRIPELKAYQLNNQKKDWPCEAVIPPPPTEAETLLRTPNQIVPTIASVDLGQMVAVTEKLLGGGLKKLGVPEATITKLRNLSSLRIDAGAMLAVSLQDTHQLYFLQLLALQARADEIKRLYLSEDEEVDEAGKPMQRVEPMTRMFWQRAHTEIVEQLGKGYDRMMAGTQAMVAMMRAKGKGPQAPKSEAGWGVQVPKSVTRAAAKSQG